MRACPIRSIAAISLALLACVYVGTTREERNFLRLSASERITAINQYPPSTRVDLYVVAMIRAHPADLQLADAIAIGGSCVLPHIAERLRRDDRDAAKTFLIYAILRMDKLSYYSVSSDQELMTLLGRQLRRIKNDEWREMATKFVQNIRPTPRPTPG
jgi:hypothetical protein